MDRFLNIQTSVMKDLVEILSKINVSKVQLASVKYSQWAFLAKVTDSLRLSGGIGVKILEVVDWSQISNQPSQFEGATATRISCS